MSTASNSSSNEGRAIFTGSAFSASFSRLERNWNQDFVFMRFLRLEASFSSSVKLLLMLPFFLRLLLLFDAALAVFPVPDAAVFPTVPSPDTELLELPADPLLFETSLSFRYDVQDWLLLPFAID